MRKLLFILILFTQISMPGFSISLRHSLSDEKKELAKAQRDLSKQQAYVIQLEEAIAGKEIERIQQEIAQVDRLEVKRTTLTHEQWLSFFYQQREILSEIIHNYPKLRSDAQHVLDEILTLITELSDTTPD